PLLELAEQVATRFDIRIEQVQQRRCVGELRDTPRHNCRSLTHIDDRYRQTGPAEAEMPRSEQAPAHDARRFRIAPIHEGARANDLRLDPQARRLGGHDLLGERFATRVRAILALLRAGERGALVLLLPRRTRRAEHRDTADVDEPRNARATHRLEHIVRGIDRMTLVAVESTR